MDLVVTEEKARQLWDDEVFRGLIQGCKHVCISLSATSGFKFLAATPTIVAFDDWNIDLQEDMQRSLAKVVDIVAPPEPDPPTQLPEPAE